MTAHRSRSVLSIGASEPDHGSLYLAQFLFADPVGHYSRPDVTRLLLNRSPQPRVEQFAPDPEEFGTTDWNQDAGRDGSALVTC